MSSYANWGGNSNVNNYNAGDDHIDVTFNDGRTYRYTASSAGRENFEEMKRLAQNGQGLNGFINKNCKYGYDSKY